MSDQRVFAGASQPASVAVSGKRIRCTCTDEQKAAADWHGRRNVPCPVGRVEDLGELAFWHRNPLKRWAWRLGQLVRRRRPGAVTFNR